MSLFLSPFLWIFGQDVNSPNYHIKVKETFIFTVQAIPCLFDIWYKSFGMKWTLLFLYLGEGGALK